MKLTKVKTRKRPIRWALLLLILSGLLYSESNQPDRRFFDKDSVFSDGKPLRFEELINQSDDASGADKLSHPSRPVYPYSVVEGGVHKPQDLKQAIHHDSVVAAHFSDFDLSQARFVKLRTAKVAYVSYRLKDKIYWTKARIKLAKGETLITDGKNYARTRCGNRVSASAQAMVLPDEPTAEVFDLAVPSDAQGSRPLAYDQQPNGYSLPKVTPQENDEPGGTGEPGTASPGTAQGSGGSSGGGAGGGFSPGSPAGTGGGTSGGGGLAGPGTSGSKGSDTPRTVPDSPSSPNGGNADPGGPPSGGGSSGLPTGTNSPTEPGGAGGGDPGIPGGSPVSPPDGAGPSNPSLPAPPPPTSYGPSLPPPSGIESPDSPPGFFDQPNIPGNPSGAMPQEWLTPSEDPLDPATDITSPLQPPHVNVVRTEAVPEPGTFLLLTTGLASYALLGRRKRRH